MGSKRGAEEDDTSSSMQPENASGPASSPFNDIQNSSSCISHQRRNSKRPKNETATATKGCQQVERGVVEKLQVPPLQGVVACLTGLPPTEKDHLHALIQSMGGRFTRELLSNENTHLIAVTNQGAKYDLARSCAPRIHIVTPSWVEACYKMQRRVEEQPFDVLINDHENDDNIDLGRSRPSQPSEPTTQQIRKAAKTTAPESISNRIYSLLRASDDTIEHASVFVACRFLLLGFDTDVKEQAEQNTSNQQLQHKLGKLIRRGKGTIYWDSHPSITHLVLHDTCHDSLRTAASILGVHHPNRPVAVSAEWLLESWQSQTLQQPHDFPPIKRKELSIESAATIDDKERFINKTRQPATTAFTSSASAVFRGCMFAIVRIAPPTWAVDFDSRHQEQVIKRNGGQMVSLKLLDALRVDAAKAHHGGTSSQPHQQNNNINNNNQDKRTCYVVCWGGFSQTHLDLNPILSQLQRHNLCNLALVTPLWLSTCVDVQKRVPPHRLPKLFTPQSWLLRRISSNDNNNNDDDKNQTPSENHPSKQVSVQRSICVSVTGFSNTERAAIRQLLQAIGATYDSGMGNACTHLMCRDPKSTTTTTAPRGPKLERALQRGLPVVTIDWVYRVAQHGIDSGSDTVIMD